MMTIKLVTPPSIEPISLADAKAYLRIGHDNMDQLIQNEISASRAVCERYTGLALITQVVDVYLDNWPHSVGGKDNWWLGMRDGAITDITSNVKAVALPTGPVQTFDELALLDEDDAATLVTPLPAYATSGLMPLLVRRNGMMWPRPLRHKAGLRIRLTVGFGAQSNDVPFALREGIFQLVAHRIDHPASAELPKGVRTLWSSYRRVGA